MITAVYHKILIPLDGSKLAEMALPHAVGQARLGDSELILLRCVSITDFTLGALELSDQAVPDETARLQREQAENYLRQIQERPQLEGLRVSTRIPAGHPAEEILDYAQSENCDLIVISSHGRTGMRRFVFGSVAERVLRHAPCPVIVVPASAGPK